MTSAPLPGEGQPGLDLRVEVGFRFDVVGHVQQEQGADRDVPSQAEEGGAGGERRQVRATRCAADQPALSVCPSGQVHHPSTTDGSVTRSTPTLPGWRQFPEQAEVAEIIGTQHLRALGQFAEPLVGAAYLRSCSAVGSAASRFVELHPPPRLPQLTSSSA